MMSYTNPSYTVIIVNGNELIPNYPDATHFEIADDRYRDMAMIEPEQKINQRVRDKRSKLEALKDFNREHVENPMSTDKRRRLKAKRKKK